MTLGATLGLVGRRVGRPLHHLLPRNYLGLAHAGVTTDSSAIPRLPALLRVTSQVVNVFFDRAIALPLEQFECLFTSRQKKD